MNVINFAFALALFFSIISIALVWVLRNVSILKERRWIVLNYIIRLMFACSVLMIATVLLDVSGYKTFPWAGLIAAFAFVWSKSVSSVQR